MMNLEFSSTAASLVLTADFPLRPEMVVVSSPSQQSISLQANVVDENDWTDIDRLGPSDSELEQLVRFYTAHPETA